MIIRHFRRPDGTVFGVDSDQLDLVNPDDVELSEEQVDEIRNPKKTYIQELSELNSWKRSEIEKMSVVFSTILLLNGPSQDDAELGLRESALASVNNKYDSDLLELKTKYGVI